MDEYPLEKAEESFSELENSSTGIIQAKEQKEKRLLKKKKKETKPE